MATSGADGTVKVWDCRNWGQTVREWTERSHGVHELDWSMKGMLAVSGKGAVNVYTDCQTSSDRAPKLYMKLDLPGRTPRSIRFCPFEDILGVGHDAGFSSLIVPGSGLAQFDSNEADVFESKTRKREKEVRGVLEKIRPDLITMDADFLGKMGAPKKEAYSERETPFYKKTRVEGRMEWREGSICSLFSPRFTVWCARGFRFLNGFEDEEAMEACGIGPAEESRASMVAEALREGR